MRKVRQSRSSFSDSVYRASSAPPATTVQVIPAATYNMPPDPPDGFVDITDVVRLTGLFGQPCPP